MAGVDLPQPLDAYVLAMNAHDVVGQVACFGPDAQVEDEGDTLVGTAQVRVWTEKVTAAYDLTVVPTQWTGPAEGGVMTALVSGSFPGSPVDFHYRVSLAGGLISWLRIEVR